MRIRIPSCSTALFFGAPLSLPFAVCLWLKSGWCAASLVCVIGLARSLCVPVAPSVARLDLLPVFSIYLLESCKFARRFPDYFHRTDDVHVHNTRNKAELYASASTFENFVHEPGGECADFV
jgi:hypothetical protein